MASSQHAIRITAHPQRRELLGALLEARRRNLGYATRAVFERERQVRGWLIVVIENATWRNIEPGRLRFLARAYGVTYESALAVLNGEADELTFVPPGPVPPLPAPAPKRKRRAREHRAVPPDLRRPIEEAPPEGRKLLGVLLAQRRTELGWTHRPAFTRDRLPLTPSGNPNTRLAADIEEAYRDSFPESRLRQLARAYQVTYESLVDVAHIRTSALVPVPPDVSAAEPLPRAPMDDAVRESAVRPYAVPIWERLLDLAGAGVRDPSGDRLGLSPDDAKVWDGSRGAMSRADRAWLVADIQRRREARNAIPRADAAGA